MAFVYVQNPTGGVFAGDRLLTKLAVGCTARVHLTTQSATRLYRMDGGEATHELRFELERDAFLESVPDVLIPQAGARYRQCTWVELDPHAMFIGAETIAPGRRASGERFEYERLEIATVVSCDGVELCADAIRLEPGRRPLDHPGILGDADYLISLLAVAPGRDPSELSAAIERVLEDGGGFHGAAGQLPNRAGAVARILAPSAVDAERAMRCAWSAARWTLLGLPLPERRK
jgi:urease accessory protein